MILRIFHMLILYIYLLVQFLFKTFACFFLFVGEGCFLAVKFLKLFIYFICKSGKHFAKIFFQSLTFHSLNSVLCGAEVFNFNIVQLIIFVSFVDHVFVMLKNAFPKLRSCTFFFLSQKFNSFTFHIQVYDPLWIKFSVRCKFCA